MRRMVRRDGKAMANLSKNHPDYGMTPAQHETTKAQRLTGVRAFEAIGGIFKGRF